MCMACCSIAWNSPKGCAFHAILEASESVLSPLPLTCLGQTECFSLCVATHEQLVHITNVVSWSREERKYPHAKNWRPCTTRLVPHNICNAAYCMRRWRHWWWRHYSYYWQQGRICDGRAGDGHRRTE